LSAMVLQDKTVGGDRDHHASNGDAQKEDN
jgi:hypothetical protein